MKSKGSLVAHIVLLILGMGAIVALLYTGDTILPYSEETTYSIPDLPGFLSHPDIDRLQLNQDGSIPVAMLYSGDYFKTNTGHAESFTISIDQGASETGSFSKYSDTIISNAEHSRGEIIADSYNLVACADTFSNASTSDFALYAWLHCNGLVWSVVYRQSMDDFFDRDEAVKTGMTFINSLEDFNSPSFRLMPAVRTITSSWPSITGQVIILTAICALLTLSALVIRFLIIRKPYSPQHKVLNYLVFIVLGGALLLLMLDPVTALAGVVSVFIFRILLSTGRKEIGAVLSKANSDFQVLLAEKDDEIHKREATNYNLLGMIDNEKKKTSTFEKENKRLTALVNSKDKEIRNFDDEKISIVKMITSQKTQIGNLENENRNLKARINQNQKIIGDKDKQITSLMDQLAKLSAESWNQVDREEYERELSQYKDRVNQLNTRILELEKTLDEKNKPQRKGREDYEKILGLKEGYTKEDLTKAHRDKAKEYHADRLGDLPELLRDHADSLMSEFNTAYDYLKKLF